VSARERLRARLKGLFGRIGTHQSPNQSSRGGAKVKAAIIHTTESGDFSFDAIVRYLSTQGVSASAHYVVDALAPKGHMLTRVTQLVPETRKAWTALSANPFGVQYELIGRARRTRQEWLGKYRAQLETVAALVADDVLQYGLPIRRAFPGVLGHVDLTRWGFPQTHWDPGPGFPWDVFLDAVRRYVSLGQRPEVTKEPAAATARPAGAPRRIPGWAWDAMRWHDSGPAGARGPRPESVERVIRKHGRLPEWYWLWRAWRLGLRTHQSK
jgi:N-acetyl-anhydromuramyl-L-alanine amidase AmpD